MNEAKKRIILHVDDESDILKVTKVILEREGFEVVDVKSGEEALAQVKLGNFDLVILDIMMPDMSGWDLFNRILEVEPSSKVIYLSVLNVSEQGLRELKEKGIKDYITKPFDRDDLVARVKKVLAE